MTEQAPYIGNDWQERKLRLAERSDEDELFDTVGGAVINYARKKAKEAKEWEQAYYSEKAMKECLLKVLEQHGIPAPDFSSGIPPIIPPNMPKQRRNPKTKEKHPGLLGKDGKLNLPKILNTQRAQTYFKLALDKGYMKIEGDHFDWIGVDAKGRKSQLAYFCGRIYNYQYSISGNTGQDFPDEELCTLFSVKGLYKLLPQIYDAKKQQGWRTILDSMFEP